VTATLDKPDGPNEPAEDLPLPTGRRGIGRRMLDAYLYGNQVVVTLLAFVLALIVGAVLIALADQATRDSLGYFFQDPGDTFSHAWHAISTGYSALFQGAIFDTDSFYSNGGVPVLGPISDTLVNAAPLILGGLAVTVAFRTGLFNIGVQGQIIIGAIFAAYVGF
jgi:general nucleoside transport system permease protein